jgi:hypothetical protein
MVTASRQHPCDRSESCSSSCPLAAHGSLAGPPAGGAEIRLRRRVGPLRVAQLLRPTRGQRSPKGLAAGGAEMCMRRRVAPAAGARPIVPVEPTACGAASYSALQLRRGTRAAHGPSWARGRRCPSEHAARCRSCGVADVVVNQVGPSGTAHISSELVKAHTPCRGRPSCRNTPLRAIKLRPRRRHGQGARPVSSTSADTRAAVRPARPERRLRSLSLRSWSGVRPPLPRQSREISPAGPGPPWRTAPRAVREGLAWKDATSARNRPRSKSGARPPSPTAPREGARALDRRAARLWEERACTRRV